jgi:hypothetical protein
MSVSYRDVGFVAAINIQGIGAGEEILQLTCLRILSTERQNIKREY